jgi:hypothetical protein
MGAFNINLVTALALLLSNHCADRVVPDEFATVAALILNIIAVVAGGQI